MRKTLWLLGALWCLPNTLIGLVLLLWYKPESSWYSRGVWHFWCDDLGRATAQTWGVLVMWNRRRPPDDAQEAAMILRHERRHVLQSMVFGAFFLLAYLIEFGIRYAWHRDYFRAYYNLSWERDARRASELRAR